MRTPQIAAEGLGNILKNIWEDKRQHSLGSFPYLVFYRREEYALLTSHQTLIIVVGEQSETENALGRH